MKQKDDLQQQKKANDDLAVEKFLALQRKAKTVGNYVHDSVPVSDNEVRIYRASARQEVD